MADEDKKEKEKGNEKEGEAQPKKGSNLKWIIIGVVVLLVLGGGGFFTWKTFLNPEQKKDVAEAGAAMRVELGPTFPLDIFIVNLAGTAGERYLKVNLELELKDSSLRAELEKREPQVRDTILLLLSSKTFEEVATFKGKTKIRNQITARLNGFLAPGSIKKVYFTEFVVQ
jgi:flagellar FliL protein